MPRPSRDYPLIFKNEVAKLDAKIAKLLDDRAKLVRAYVVVTGDTKAFGTAGVQGPDRDISFRGTETPHKGEIKREDGQC